MIVHAKMIRSVALGAVPAVAVVAIALLAAAPLFHAGIPSTDDGMNHLVKFAGFSQSLSHGNLFPRLVQSLNLGYGSPVFTYYAPLSYYIAQAFHLLGQDVNGSVRAVFALAILLGALGMYFAGCDLGGKPAGLVAGAAQGALPYLLYNVYLRGAMPEELAMGLEPWTLFAFSRYARTDHSRWLVLAAGTTAAIALTHNISTLIFLPFLALWGIVVVLRETPGSPALVPRRWIAVQRVLAASALGFGAAGVFWLPALLEQGAVHLERTLATGSIVEHFNPVALPWSPAFFFAYAHNTDQLPLRPGLVQVSLALGGAAIFALRTWQSPKRRPLWLLLCVPAAVLLLFLQHGPSAFIWAHVPLAAYVQFPYRLYALFGLITSLFAGFLTLAVRHAVGRWAIAVVAALLSVVVGLRQLHPIYGYGVPPDLDQRGLLLTETASGQIGGTANAEYLPRTVTESPNDIIATVALPRGTPGVTELPDTTATVNQVSETEMAINVHTTKPMPITFRRFYMPGWTAKASGHSLDVHPSGPLGLLTVDVLPSDHLVELRNAQIHAEAAALVTSAACLIVLGFWMFSRGSTWTWFNEEARGYVVIFMLVAAAAVVLLAPRSSREVTLLPTTPVDIALCCQLAGMQVDRSQLASRGTLQVILHILFRRAGSDLLFDLRAQDQKGHVFARAKGRPWNGSTGYWQAGEIGDARIDLTLPPNVPRQAFDLSITAFESQQPDQELATVSLVETDLPVLPRHPYHELATNVAGALLLRGYRVDGPEQDDLVLMPASRGMDVTLDLQSLHPIYQNLKLFVHLIGPDGRSWPQQDQMVGGDLRQTGSWQPGETARQTIAVKLPSEATPGIYAFEFGVYDPATLQRLSILDASGRTAGDSVRFARIEVGAQ